MKSKATTTNCAGIGNRLGSNRVVCSAPGVLVPFRNLHHYRIGATLASKSPVGVRFSCPFCQQSTETALSLASCKVNPGIEAHLSGLCRSAPSPPQYVPGSNEGKLCHSVEKLQPAPTNDLTDFQRHRFSFLLCYAKPRPVREFERSQGTT